MIRKVDSSRAVVAASDPALREAMEAFDRGWREGRAEEEVAIFSEDAHMLLSNKEAVVGRDGIRGWFAPLAEAYDLSEYAPEYDVIDVHGDRAYVLGSFDEVLRPRAGGSGIRIKGRLVVFWRRDTDGAWRVFRFLTARSAPDEPAG